ncbi:hypothetical protein E3Z29_13110 [Pseudomonas sp. S150]|nr:hypothetical protein E3Z29_13110 [Pseudomonas sp. S150]
MQSLHRLPKRSRRRPTRPISRRHRSRFRRCSNTHTSHVGAGLLAKAEYQSMYMLIDTALSRASPLPHLFCGVLKSRYIPPTKILR